MSKQKTLSFAALEPERHAFELPGGEQIEFRSRLDFSEQDMGKLSKIEQRLNASQRRLESDPSDKQAAKGLRKATEQFVLLILPDLPAELLEKMTLGQKSAILSWWTEQEQAPPAEDLDLGE
jgi:cysteinyl-tRNA synthetase